MSKGREKHQARLNELSLFGKDLARRSGRKCELCEASGVALKAVEVEPAPKEPDFDYCVFICDTCDDQLRSPKRRDHNHWRCLTQSVWSETPAIQALSIWLVRQIPEDWATDTVEMIFADDDVMQWADTISFEGK
ncbi:hypothetical protein [uncultured Umboniibacter sp.]|uniref:hypothetical protein n=1 Tax=uncultured Umboniibacter sp. TaxID=1798917 RepID=UPI00260233DC|nr:hypothetical protein [uncultured Umboniibacter sp.]